MLGLNINDHSLAALHSYTPEESCIPWLNTKPQKAQTATPLRR